MVSVEKAWENIPVQFPIWSVGKKKKKKKAARNILANKNMKETKRGVEFKQDLTIPAG